MHASLPSFPCFPRTKLEGRQAKRSLDTEHLDIFKADWRGKTLEEQEYIRVLIKNGKAIHWVPISLLKYLLCPS